MVNPKKRIVIIGATSLIAEHCARLWVNEAPVDLILVGRNKAKMEVVAADLQVRSSTSSIKCYQIDFTAPEKIDELGNELVKEGSFDLVLIAHGALLEQALCQKNLELCQQSLLVNGISPVLFAEMFVKHMEKANKGTLALISSVAGDRGRKSNYVYGASKSLVSQYTQGLQHRLAHTNLHVILIKPGPTDTPMTASLKQQGVRMAKVEQVAKQIVNGINAKKKIIYAPAKWRLIMLIIRHLPSSIFNKMDI